MTKRELAESLFLKGYNCAQSAAGAFSDEVNLPLDVLLKSRLRLEAAREG